MKNFIPLLLLLLSLGKIANRKREPLRQSLKALLNPSSKKNSRPFFVLLARNKAIMSKACRMVYKRGLVTKSQLRTTRLGQRRGALVSPQMGAHDDDDDAPSRQRHEDMVYQGVCKDSFYYEKKTKPKKKETKGVVRQQYRPLVTVSPAKHFWWRIRRKFDFLGNRLQKEEVCMFGGSWISFRIDWESEAVGLSS